MSDLIDRQAAIDAIYGICNEPVAWLIRAASEIEKLPPAQPEIIHCRDCQWYNAGERTCNDLIGFGRYWKPDDFCSYGRKTDD